MCHADYYPFGESLGAGCAGYDHYQFAGLYADDDGGGDGMMSAGHRRFNEDLGRWLSPDPAGVKVVSLTDPQSWNLYMYSHDNPVTFNDPSGLCSSGGRQHGWIWCAANSIENWWKKQEAARIANERNWLINNVAQNPAQVRALRGASNSQVDALYDHWSEAFQNAICPWYSPCDVMYEASDFHRNTQGAFVLYRGGPGFRPRVGRDIELDAEGNVKPGSGVSVNTDPGAVERFGGAYKFDSQMIPPRAGAH